MARTNGIQELGEDQKVAQLGAQARGPRLESGRRRHHDVTVLDVVVFVHIELAEELVKKRKDPV